MALRLVIAGAQMNDGHKELWRQPDGHGRRPHGPMAMLNRSPLQGVLTQTNFRRVVLLALIVRELPSLPTHATSSMRDCQGRRRSSPNPNGNSSLSYHTNTPLVQTRGKGLFGTLG